MTHLLRAVTAVGLGALLLAAGKAPVADSVAPVEAPQAQVQAASTGLSIEEIYRAQHTALNEYTDEVWQPPQVDDSAAEAGLDVAEVSAASSLSDAVHRIRAANALSMEDADMECLAIAIYFESKSEPLTGQLAVAEVILNRVESGRFGNSICDVVKAPRQFSFVRNGNLGTPRHARQYETAQAIAWIALNKAWNTVVGNATHFHANYVNPRWKLQHVASIGNHIFYR